MSNLITPETLRARLQDPNIVIIDTRFDLQDATAGRRAYQQDHIPGARYFHLDEDLSSPPKERGGRHPLPDMATFVGKLEQAGVSNDHAVVVYDSSGAVFAGRLWWTLRYLGHDDVKILDGGYQAWLEAQYPVTQDVPSPAPARFTPHLRPEMLVDMEEVRRKLEDPSTLLIDARGADRYRGEHEPLDKKAGHIPSAINKPYAENLQGGHFKDAAALRARFSETEEADEVIMYCGSGVSAAHNIVAMAEAGLPTPRLYVGSWSDWSSVEENPVATGDDT